MIRRVPLLVAGVDSLLRIGPAATGLLVNAVAFVLSAVDQNFSPIQVANTTACVAFGAGGIGEMLQPGAAFPQVGTITPDGGTSGYYTCCAQTATASPAQKASGAIPVLGAASLAMKSNTAKSASRPCRSSRCS